jgi:membrane protein
MRSLSGEGNTGRALAKLRRAFDVVVRVYRAGAADDVDVMGAGLAFYALLGLFPALLAMVSILGLVASPAWVERLLESLTGVVPIEARSAISSVLRDFMSRPPARLSLGFIVPTGAVLWSASSAMGVFVRAINLAYDLPEHRSFFNRRLMALSFTLGAIVAIAVVVPAMTALPAVLQWLGVSVGLSLLRWPLIGALAFGALLVAFRYAPEDDRFRSYRSALPGAVVASVLWLVVSGLYSTYVAYLASYETSYGALEGVIVLAIWLYVSALVVLYGAELNAELATTPSSPKTPIHDRGVILPRVARSRATPGNHTA